MWPELKSSALRCYVSLRVIDTRLLDTKLKQRGGHRVSLYSKDTIFISAAHPWLNKSTTSPENDGRVSDEVFVSILASTSKILQTRTCIVFT